METKNNEEMITVNGGCFPISWVRKFFNIETADIKDEAVTEAKLDPTLVSEIRQTLKGLDISGDDVSGKITLTTTAGDTIDKALPIANAKRAGLMSGSDYAKLQQSVTDVDATFSASAGTLKVTHNNGTTTTKTIPAATNTTAGLMTAADTDKLNNAVTSMAVEQSSSLITVKTTKASGSTSSVGINAATNTTAGVMSSDDKKQLAGSVADITTKLEQANVGLVLNTHSSGSTTRYIPSATTSSAGVMSATDKQQLNNSVSGISLQTGANQVDIKVTNTYGSTSTKTISGATTDLAGLMTAADKKNLNATVRNASATLENDKVNLIFEKTDGSKTTDSIPTATEKAAGLMSADDKHNIENVKDIKNEAIGKTTFNRHYSSAGDIYFDATTVGGGKVEKIVTIPIAQARTGAEASGLMAAQDKINLDKSLNSLSSSTSATNVVLTTKDNTGNSATVTLDSASTSKAGVMSATDKGNLDKSLNTPTLSTDTEKVNLSFGSPSGSKSESIPSATSVHAGAMSAQDKSNLDALKKKADTVPTELEVEAPARITRGNLAAQYVKATILPEACEQNIIYQTDGDSIHMEPDGQITVKGTGKTRIHVIPLEKTKLYKTVVVDVTEPWMRKVGSVMRFDTSGNIRLI